MGYILVDAAEGIERAWDIALDLEQRLRRNFNREIRVYTEMPCENGHYYELCSTPYSDHQKKCKQPYLKYVYGNLEEVQQHGYRIAMLSQIINTQILRGTAVIIVGGMTRVPYFYEGTYEEYVTTQVPVLAHSLGKEGIPAACVYDRGINCQDAFNDYTSRAAKLWMEFPSMAMLDYDKSLSLASQINSLI